MQSDDAYTKIIMFQLYCHHIHFGVQLQDVITKPRHIKTKTITV